MVKAIVMWRILKLFNLNKLFRRQLRTMPYSGKFYVRKIVWLERFYYAVNFVRYIENTHKYVVMEVINHQEMEVDESQIFLNNY